MFTSAYFVDIQRTLALLIIHSTLITLNIFNVHKIFTNPFKKEIKQCIINSIRLLHI